MAHLNRGVHDLNLLLLHGRLPFHWCLGWRPQRLFPRHGLLLLGHNGAPHPSIGRVGLHQPQAAGTILLVRGLALLLQRRHRGLPEAKEHLQYAPSCLERHVPRVGELMLHEGVGLLSHVAQVPQALRDLDGLGLVPRVLQRVDLGLTVELDGASVVAHALKPLRQLARRPQVLRHPSALVLAVPARRQVQHTDDDARRHRGGNVNLQVQGLLAAHLRCQFVGLVRHAARHLELAQELGGGGLRHLADDLVDVHLQARPRLRVFQLGSRLSIALDLQQQVVLLERTCLPTTGRRVDELEN
mmetsp:Transcript_93544/g.209425  ORF Transcript_93544/g.209425 Transcript_93544/m.209425 type:complete len:300 (+) Transcript_93544:1483-2382(+)